jgi:Ser/Thr protein kinase RdoA (MazF antagonist)
MIDANLLQKVGAGRTATIYRWGQNQVVKLYRPNFPKKAIDEEFQIGQTLNQVDLDIPKTYELVQLEESKGILLDYVRGPSMLQTLATRPWRVFSYSKQMARLHFKIHGASILIEHSIPMLKESLADKISRVTLLTAEERTKILSRLSTLMDGASICHGDFHPDNIIMAKDRLMTVDWITARIGNPIADVARTWLLLSMGSLPENKTAFEIFLARNLRDIFCRGYLREYKKLSTIPSAEFERWKLPIAAARLIENVSDQENQNLLRFIRSKLLKAN